MKGTVTEFGKELRKIRVDASESQKDMARRLGFTAAYLSMIEVGKCNVPLGMTARVKELYGLSDEEESRLEEAQGMSARKRVIELDGASPFQREAAALFVQAFKGLSDGQCAAIREILLSAVVRRGQPLRFLEQ